jgi:hypothetical protein
MGELATASRGRSSPERTDDQKEVAVLIPAWPFVAPPGDPFGVTRPVDRLVGRAGFGGADHASLEGILLPAPPGFPRSTGAGFATEIFPELGPLRGSSARSGGELLGVTPSG